MLGMEVCPQCKNPTKGASSRLVQDTCGHKKCRLCLLQEENGCATCARNSTKAEGTGGILPRTSICEFSNPEEDDETIYEKSIEIRTTPLYQSKTCDNSSDANKDKSQTQSEEFKVPKEVTKRKWKRLEIRSHITVLSGNPTQYQCTVCMKSFTCKYNLRYHNFCASETKPYTCDVCNKGFVTKSHFEYHLRIHTGDLPYICSVCGKGFRQKGKLTRHIKSHTGDRPYICQVCGKGFLNSDGLKNHQRIHTGEKPYVCKICQKAFAEGSNYNKHVQIHSDQKLFMCEECGKSFVLKQKLEAHLYTHTGERNHVCKLCSRAFVAKQDLKRHQIVHSNARPYSCTLCESEIRFRRKDNLDRHMKNTHPEKRANPPTLQQQLPEPAQSDPKGVNAKEQVTMESIKETVPSTDTPNTEPKTSTDAPSLDPKTSTDTSNTEPKVSSEECKKNKYPFFRRIIQIGNQSTDPVQPTTLKKTIQPPRKRNMGKVPALQSDVESECADNLQQKCVADNVSNRELSEVVRQTEDIQPKKNVEYYRAVPVINRPTNIVTSFIENVPEIEVSKTGEVDRQVFEGKNCVRTITRASDILGASGQEVQTIVKPVTSAESFKKLLNDPPRSHQPMLRMLLNDVQCSNENVVQDANPYKTNLLYQDNLRLTDKYDKIANKGLYDPKLSDIYPSHFLLSNYDASHSQYVPSERMYAEDFSMGYNQGVCYDELMTPSYMLDDVAKRNPSVADSLFMTEQAKCANVSYPSYLRNEDVSEKLKLLADVAGTKDTSPLTPHIIVYEKCYNK